MRIFEHNFSDNKEKGRRHTVLCLVLLTQLAEKFAKKTCVAKILNRLLEDNGVFRRRDTATKRAAFENRFRELLIYSR